MNRLHIYYRIANDGHDTNVTFASKWAIDFLTPLLKNPHFNGPKTLIILSTLISQVHQNIDEFSSSIWREWY